MYTGRLIRLGIPFRKLPDYNELDISKCMMKYGYADCRKMLFSINESEKTSDVLFTSPSYPICDRMKIIKPEDILIEEKVYLRNTLIYLGFGEKLTRRDINRLYGML
jgi:hypothetical protein